IDLGLDELVNDVKQAELVTIPRVSAKGGSPVAGLRVTLSAGDRERSRLAQRVALIGFARLGFRFGNLFRSSRTADSQFSDANARANLPRASLAARIQADICDADPFLIVHRLAHGSVGIDDGRQAREETFDLVRGRLV